MSDLLDDGFTARIRSELEIVKLVAGTVLKLADGYTLVLKGIDVERNHDRIASTIRRKDYMKYGMLPTKQDLAGGLELDDRNALYDEYKAEGALKGVFFASLGNMFYGI